MQSQEGWHRDRAGSGQPWGRTPTWTCWCEQPSSIQEACNISVLKIEIQPVELIWDQQVSRDILNHSKLKTVSPLETKTSFLLATWHLSIWIFLLIVTIEHLSAFPSTLYSEKLFLGNMLIWFLFRELDEKTDTTLMSVHEVQSWSQEATSPGQHKDWKPWKTASLALLRNN